MLVLFRYSQQTISNILQAQAVITLVLVTWFYAQQTKYLVDEQKNAIRETKRKIQVDFLERRISEFYHPYILLLDKIKDVLNSSEIEHLRADSFHEELSSLYFKREYMTNISITLVSSMNSIIAELRMYGRQLGPETISKFNEITKSVRDFLVAEWRDIEREIKEYYSTSQL